MIKLYTPMMFAAVAGLSEAFPGVPNDQIVPAAKALARDLIDLTNDTPSPAEFWDICLSNLVLLTGQHEDKLEMHSVLLGDFIYNAMCNVTNEIRSAGLYPIAQG